jgi:NAD+ synthase (glutamine-hydrolysing)
LTGIGQQAELAGAHIVMNPSAENEMVMSDHRRRILHEALSRENICAYINASAGFGESSQDMVYAGAASIWENGRLLSENERFLTD